MTVTVEGFLTRLRSVPSLKMVEVQLTDRCSYLNDGEIDGLTLLKLVTSLEVEVKM